MPSPAPRTAVVVRLGSAVPPKQVQPRPGGLRRRAPPPAATWSGATVKRIAWWTTSGVARQHVAAGDERVGRQVRVEQEAVVVVLAAGRRGRRVGTARHLEGLEPLARAQRHRRRRLDRLVVVVVRLLGDADGDARLLHRGGRVGRLVPDDEQPGTRRTTAASSAGAAQRDRPMARSLGGARSPRDASRPVRWVSPSRPVPHLEAAMSSTEAAAPPAPPAAPKGTLARPRTATWLDRAARLGFVAKGLVYVLIGILTLQVAIGDSEQTDQNGALQSIAEKPFGSIVLWPMVLGFLGVRRVAVQRGGLGPARRDRREEAHRQAPGLGRGRPPLPRASPCSRSAP